jgi:DNA-directed RNA polymerase specialized sigma24 family protein
MRSSSLDPARGLDKFAANFIRQASKRLIGKYGYLPDDREDIEQELAAELIARFAKWDPAKGARTTYTSAVLKHTIASIVRRRRAERRNKARSPQSLDAATVNVDDEAVSLARAIPDASKFKHTG